MVSSLVLIDQDYWGLMLWHMFSWNSQRTRQRKKPQWWFTVQQAHISLYALKVNMKSNLISFSFLMHVYGLIGNDYVHFILRQDFSRFGVSLMLANCHMTISVAWMPEKKVCLEMQWKSLLIKANAKCLHVM